jgi:UDP-glucose 6-dehydrogenase
MKQEGSTLVVGIGEVGGALAAILERGLKVLRHDIEPREFKEPIGIMHLCFPFIRREPFERTAISYIERFKPGLTIINSTVIPGTTCAVARAANAPVVFSPVRGKHIRMVEDLLRYTKFIASSDPTAGAQAEVHFQAAGIKTQRVAKVETLELAKLAETAYFGLLITYAQELSRWASRVGGDYDEAISFFEESDFLPRVRYSPGFIGGHCVIENVKLLQQVVSSGLLEAMLRSNQRRAAERYEPADLAKEL